MSLDIVHVTRFCDYWNVYVPCNHNHKRHHRTVSEIQCMHRFIPDLHCSKMLSSLLFDTNKLGSSYFTKVHFCPALLLCFLFVAALFCCCVFDYLEIITLVSALHEFDKTSGTSIRFLYFSNMLVRLEFVFDGKKPLLVDVRVV